LGDQCGGNFVYTEEGIKNCSGCLLPHGENGYAYDSSKLRAVSELAKKNLGKTEA
jgi:Zn-finger protein